MIKNNDIPLTDRLEIILINIGLLLIIYGRINRMSKLIWLFAFFKQYKRVWRTLGTH